MEPVKNVLIIDDHPLFREGLKTIIGREAGYTVIAEAGTGNDGLRMALEHSPELAVVDISLPDTNGIELTKELLRRNPELRVLVVSMHTKVDYIVEAFQAGATGYLVKDSATDKLIQGLESAVKGEFFLDSAVSQGVVEKLLEFKDKKNTLSDASYSSLTTREQEVMRLLAEGCATKDVADRLFISPKTVENHRTNLMKKLNLKSTVDLVRYAARLGLIDLEDWTS